jgi:catechol 2,3-dioxygenase-like lactoylglutathione lyase family enzyme
MDQFDRTAEDVGNIVEFGHVSVRVPDQQLATLFYVTGLGLTRDPYLMTSTDNMWMNAGTDQFHLPTGPAQVMRGTSGVVVPDLAHVIWRLQRVAPMLSGTKFSYAVGEGVVEAACPWGNRIRLHAPDRHRFGPIVLGIAYVELATPPGTAAGIARFYQQLLGAPAQLEHGCASVGAGATTRLVYRETEAAQPDYDGAHIQVSLADFSGPHRRLLERGLVTEESDQHQYRFQALVDPDSGATLVEIEHEVRSMKHPLFARPLLNRNPDQTNRQFSQGRENSAWTMLPT